MIKIYSILIIFCFATAIVAEASQLETLVQASGTQATSSNYQLKPVIGETVIGRLAGSNQTVILGFLAEQTTFFTPILSIKVEPKLWNIGSTQVNNVVTMTQANKITITNDGNVAETLELKLINPAGWTASTIPGQEIYVLNGLFCNLNDVPQANHFNQDTSNEDVLTLGSQRATSTVFGYSQATANGMSVPSGSSRSLYLQFKSPTITQKKEEQNISVIVSCQIP